MISVTKLYSFLSTWFAAIIIFIAILFGVNMILIHGQNNLNDKSEARLLEVMNQTTEANQKNFDMIKSYVSNGVYDINDKLDSLTGSTSVTRNVTQINLIHYFAEVEICSEDYPSYKVKIDFYGINPRIEDGKLMILSERFTADYHEYFPIFDKNIGYDANLCGLKLLNK